MRKGQPDWLYPPGRTPAASPNSKCFSYGITKHGTSDEDEHIFPAIRAGALSYLLKDVEPTELATAVRKAAAGEAILHPRVVQEVHGSRGDTRNPFHELSERELEVLRLVAGGMSNRNIANSLSISEKTVKSHVGNILSKLHLADRTQAAVYAWREGIVHREEE